MIRDQIPCTMIYAKITPPVLTPVQPNPFDPPTYAEGHYLMATIPNYELGSSQTSARSVYGIPIFNDENVLINWRAFYVENVELGQTVMQNWGTNDSIVLYAIAEKRGVQIVEILQTDISPVFTFK